MRLDTDGDNPQNGIEQKLRFDAWNRLVRFERKTGSSSWDLAAYDYNALNWRVKERREYAGSTAPGANTTRFTFYSLAWQQMLELIKDPSKSNGASKRTVQSCSLVCHR